MKLTQFAILVLIVRVICSSLTAAQPIKNDLPVSSDPHLSFTVEFDACPDRIGPLPLHLVLPQHPGLPIIRDLLPCDDPLS